MNNGYFFMYGSKERDERKFHTNKFEPRVEFYENHKS